MIKPTLFVGLGTTGTKIIKSLRQLMFEEYGHAGLPIFRYIAIETDGDEKGVDPELQMTSQMDDYERIELVSATINSTIPINDKLNPNHTRYNPHLADWLDSNILKVEAHRFDVGAKNIRMAGRLCLWENWDDMQEIVNRTRAAIIAQDTTEKARQLLRQYYKAKRRPLPQTELIDSNTINVYIVGSLCGGSCSGMLLDVAYFFRSLSAGTQTSNIFGIFTMFDRQHATGNDSDTQVRAANCYASLVELNYYSHEDTTYEIVFPNGHRVEKTRKKPFDFATFVSRSSITPNIRHVLPGGGFDEDGLNLMVALNMFAETAGDTDEKKAAVRTDWDSYEGIWGLKNPEIQGDISYMVKFMSTFGLTAIKYPKYRIAKATASLVSKDLTSTLLGKYTKPEIILADAASDWNSIYAANMDKLTEPEGQTTIRARIETELNSVIASKNTQKQTAFNEKFMSGGEYYELINLLKPECEKAYINAIQQLLTNRLEEIDFQNNVGLEDIIAYFDAFDKEIEKSIKSLPERLPELNMNLDLTPVNSILNSWWTKSLGLHKKATSESQGNVITEYRNMVLGNRESAYQKMRNFFLRKVLETIRGDLGFGVQPTDVETSIPKRTIKQKLDNIRTNLNASLQSFENDYQSAINMRNYVSVKIVTDNPQNRIELDVKALHTVIMQDRALSPLDNGQSMNGFLSQGHKEITAQMNETYRRMALEKIPVKDVVTKAREILETGGVENDITNMASRSNPYQVFTQKFSRLAVDVPPKIICGDNSNKNALTNLQESLGKRDYRFPRIGGSSVDHLLFFYEEEASFAMDDLDAYVMLEEHFQNQPGTYGHLTHQNEGFYDLALYHKTQTLQQWCLALGRIVPEIKNKISEDAFSDIFHYTNNRYVYEYIIDGLPERLALHAESDGIKKLAQKNNNSAFNDFISSVRKCFSNLDREEIQELIGKLLQSVEDDREHAELSDFFRRFLDDVYANVATTDTPDSNPLTGSTFFDNVSSQDSQSHQPDETPPPTDQEEDSEIDAQQSSVETDDFGATTDDEGKVETEKINQTPGETPQEPSSQDKVTTETHSGFVNTNAGTNTEPNPAEDTNVEQQPSPETDEPEQKQQPDKELSSANKVEPPPRRRRTRK